MVQVLLKPGLENFKHHFTSTQVDYSLNVTASIEVYFLLFH